ncbi:MAG: cell division protein FtsK [Candidatus Cloacimonadota bacterium]|nr:MAG: cell division protein FtsK [Candidatus Cloacimonadota bacterium]PIE77904.1 MAG: cell division protein FtsK [Candidatus Delongbacteria bacterium]
MAKKSEKVSIKKSKVIKKKDKVESSNKREIVSITFLVLGVLLTYGMISTSEVGTAFNLNFGKASQLIKIVYSFTFGKYFGYIIPAIFILLSWMIFRKRTLFIIVKTIFVIMFLGSLLSTLSYIYRYSLDDFSDQAVWEYAGFLGSFMGKPLTNYIGVFPSVIIVVAVILISSMLLFKFSFYRISIILLTPIIVPVNIIMRLFRKILSLKEGKDSNFDYTFNKNSYLIESESEDEIKSLKEEDLEIEKDNDTLFIEKDLEKPLDDIKKTDDNSMEDCSSDITINKKVEEKEEFLKNMKDSALNYVTPPVALLKDQPKISNSENESQFRENAKLLEEKLQEFSVDASVVQINPGPVITQYEIKLAKGVKISKVNSLEKDLAMNLRAKSVRIVAPIPGKDTVGIEIPNKKPSIVSIKSIINSEKYINHKSKLKISLGKTITGENYILDLKKTPHLLIAGATGSGKSVCINGIIMSILYTTTPEEVQFCMIDPKKVELSLYSELINHHLLKIDGIDEAVVTKPEDALRLLESLVDEMERRYEILKDSGTRNLEEYNDCIDSGDLTYNPSNGDKFEKIPYIVCIVDEYGDLMMTSGKAVEDPICRLAQMARAVGIHMVLATQRPSVKVVTGIIKANFPTRIAFRVMSQIDSRTILDQKGAESLLGKGDMLIIPPGDADTIRLQNALVETKEVNEVVKFIKNQKLNFNRIKIKAKPKAEEFDPNDLSMRGDSSNLDEYYEEAKNLVITHQMASVSMLQRALSIGYARAGKIIDQLERNGVVGPHVGSKSREVLKSE